MANSETALRPRADVARKATGGGRGSRSLGPAHLLTFAIICAGLFGAMRPSPDPDSWWHLATGRWIIDSGTIPNSDPFSWTASGKAWVAHEWASDLMFAVVDSWFGPLGLLWMQGIFVGISLLLLRTTLRRLTGNEWIVAVALGLTLYLISLMWTLRPHLISLLLIVFFLDTLVAYQAGEADRRVWALIPLTIVWANLHAGFLSGVLLVWVFTGVGLLERRPHSRRLLFVAAGSTVAGALNPAGIEIYAFSIYLARVSDFVAEWQPPGIRDPRGFVLTAAVVGVPTLIALTKRRCDPALLATAFVFGFLGLGAIRNIWLAGVLISPALAIALGGLDWIPRPTPAKGNREKQLLLGAHAAVLLAGLFVVWISQQGRSESWLRAETAFPKAAAETLAGFPPGRMVNPYDWGGYLIWKLPEFPVSVDNRADLYGYELLDDMQRLEGLKPGWDSYLRRNGVEYVIWQKDRPLAEALRLLDDWRLLRQDDEAVLFHHSGPE
jgi:hypothetical protein